MDPTCPDPAVALSSLPETVKRNILSRLLGAGSVQGSQEVLIASPDAIPDAGHMHPEEIAGRHITLPLLCAGAAVVDNVFTSGEVQVRSNALLRTPCCHADCPGPTLLTVCPLDCQAVASAVETWLLQHGRRPGMGSQASGGLWQDSSYRGDINCWVNPAELKEAGQPVLAACLQMLSGLRTQLVQQGCVV